MKMTTSIRWQAPWRSLQACFALVATSLALAACGGVGEEGTGVQPASASVGMAQGLSDTTVTVNGVSYERSAASVADGFGRAMPADDLRLGMWLEVQGSIDDTGTQGVARSIRVRPAARGIVTAHGPGGLTLTVFDSTVKLDNGTVLDGTPDAASLTAGDLVEVHGPLSNAAGDVTASRLEKLNTTLQAPPIYELRGRVSQLDASHGTMTVGRRSISYAQARVTVRNALADGQVVRVSAASAPADGVRWSVDRLTSDVALPANLGFLYTEGFVDRWLAGPSFMLEDLPVDASSANGKAEVQADGQRVAVVGALVAGTLKAKAVAVVQPGEPVVFTLSGPVTDFVSLASFKLRGVAIDASTASYVSPATPEGMAGGVRVRIKGTMLGRQLIASQVSLLPPP